MVDLPVPILGDFDSPPTNPLLGKEERKTPVGYIDFFGYSQLSGGWVFCGWVAAKWQSDSALSLVGAQFQNGKRSGESIALTYARPDLADRGQGVLLFIPGAIEPDLGEFTFIEIGFDGQQHRVRPTTAVRKMAEQDMNIAVRSLLGNGAAGKQRDELAVLFSHSGYGGLKHPLSVLDGIVDAYGYAEAANGWLFSGWVTRSWSAEGAPDAIVAHFENDDVSGKLTAAFHRRADVKDRGVGFVLFVEGPSRPAGRLVSLELRVNGVSSIVPAGKTAKEVSGGEFMRSLRAPVSGAQPGLARDALQKLLSRESYAGADNLAAVKDRVLLHFDEVIHCPPGGLLLFGWILARADVIREITLRSGMRSSPIRLDQGIRIDRPDVIKAVGAERGFSDVRCGFGIFLPSAFSPGDETYVAIETESREVAYLKLPSPKLEGMAAIKRTVGEIDLRYTDLADALDKTIGPALVQLNQHRLSQSPRVTSLDFGRVAPAPRFSIIVPLYGRIDFVEYQLALFSRHATAFEYEFIFVLDDPAKRREVERLFDSLYQRFRIPFRALMLEENVGYARANNVGLRAAAGQYVCFLNSDVFPKTTDWLERLAGRLEADPEIGVVGPMLLFDDDSVQHEGLSYKRLPEFGNWLFCDHPRKGMRKTADAGLRRRISITGACMVMRRHLAQEIGGFSESYIMGDFEDADLCWQLQQKGLGCAVDLDLELYHLERKSHPGSAHNWSRNLTFFNAWVHNNRWASAITNHPLFSESSTIPN
jgi:GT2 family glycosyltransferase